MMWGDHWGWGWGMAWPMLFGGLIPLLLFAVCTYLLVQALNRGGGGASSLPPPGLPRRETALDVAQRRYASGELSRDEFIRMRDDLTGAGGGGAPPSG